MTFSRLVFLTTLSAVLALSPLSQLSAQQTKREIHVTENADYFGFDLRSVEDVSLDQCKQICVADGDCRAFTYNTRVNWCFLKSDFNKLMRVFGRSKFLKLFMIPSISC